MQLFLRTTAVVSGLLILVAAGPALAQRAAEQKPKPKEEKKPSQKEPSFVGSWATTYGTMLLVEREGAILGGYFSDGGPAVVEGKVDGKKLTFRYHETTETGQGWFEMAEDGQSFAGQWKAQGAEAWQDWSGKRIAPPEKDKPSYAGVFHSSYGGMRLVQDGANVRGIYGLGGGSTIEGNVENGALKFTYNESGVAGEGSFEMSADGGVLFGLWRQDGTNAWATWVAGRRPQVEGLVWLVVLEARWEHSLAEPEFTYGEMLRAYFARVPRVAVRHRIFYDEHDLKRAAGEIAYLPGPVLLCVASHGTEEGVSGSDGTISLDALAQSLKYADNVQLLHFSACCIMSGEEPEKLQKKLAPAVRFPVSGYTMVADWAASVVLEFLYFDLVLERGMPPEKAAEEVKKQIRFSGESAVTGSTVAPAGFKILPAP
ncbi:MAG: hypothetical protein HYS13_05880 [Planctomycetia bacterium]|nr:hypothetical protein [Planctomycetia bacterium]